MLNAALLALLSLCLSSPAFAKGEDWRFMRASCGNALSGANFLPFLPAGTYISVWDQVRRTEVFGRVIPIIENGHRSRLVIDFECDECGRISMELKSLRHVTVESVPGFKPFPLFTIKTLQDVFPFLPIGTEAVILGHNEKPQAVVILAGEADGDGMDPKNVHLKFSGGSRAIVSIDKLKPTGILSVPAEASPPKPRESL